MTRGQRKSDVPVEPRTAELAEQLRSLTDTLNAFTQSATTLANVASNRLTTVNLPIDLSITYGGRSDTTAARAWLTAWKANINIHALDNRSAIEIARRTLTRSANAWFIHIYNSTDTIEDFEHRFWYAFMPQLDIVELTTQMAERTESSTEEIMDYIHDKIRLMESLKMTVASQVKYVAKGCRWPAMSSHLLNATVIETDDIINVACNFVDCTKKTAQPPPPPPNRRSNAAPAVSTSTSKPGTNIRVTPKSTSMAENSILCYNCFGHGHMVKDCPQPRRILKCANCSQMGHVKSKCPDAATAIPKITTTETGTALCATNALDMPSTPFEAALEKYTREVTVGKTTVLAQIDPGSCDCLFTASCAIQSGYVYEPCVKSYRVIGPGPTALGLAVVPITIDEITLNVPIYVVPDANLPIPLLVGRTWTDDPSVLFVRIRNTFKFLRHDKFAMNQLAAMFDEPELSVLKTSASVKIGPEASFVGFVVESQWRDPACLLVVDNAARIIVAEQNEYKLLVHSANTLDLPVNTVVGQVLRLEELVTEVPTELWKPFTMEQLPTGPNLTTEQKLLLLETVNNYRRAFATSIQELGCTDLVTMEIDEIPGSAPCSQKPYRTSIDAARVLDENIEEWRNAGIVEPSTSPYAAPALLVDKKNGNKWPVFRQMIFPSRYRI